MEKNKYVVAIVIVRIIHRPIPRFSVEIKFSRGSWSQEWEVRVTKSKLEESINLEVHVATLLSITRDNSRFKI